MLLHLPKSINKVHETINLIDIKTNRFEQFVLSNDHHTYIIVFSCIENTTFLCFDENILLNGTFN